MTDHTKLELVPVTAPSASELGEEPVTATTVEAPQPATSIHAPKPDEAISSMPTPRSQSDVVASSAEEPWRNWGSFDRTASYRLPAHLLEELEERLWRLRLPVGVAVAAALAHLLDEPDERINELVACAERAKPRRRRRP